MRSVKQVKRAHRIRSLKNAAACKRSAYRRKMQAKHNWQANTVFTGFRLPTVNAPTPTPRKTKEPKQRTAEEIAERQRAREQKRLEKELAKQKASTSALPKLKKTKQEKRPIEESAEKEIIHPKQQSSKKEKVKVEAEEVHEKRPRVEPEKRKGTVKEPSNETRENSVKIAKAEKKEPKIPTKELETEKKKPNAEITERKAKQPGPSESEADGKEKKSKQRAPRESDTDTKEKKAKQRAQPETDADTKERKTKQRAPPEPEADTKEKETKQPASRESDTDIKEKKAKQRAPTEPDADTKERKTKQRAPSEPDADTKEKETEHSAPPESGAVTKERKSKQSAQAEPAPTKSKKKGKKGAEIPMAQQHPIVEEVQLKKTEDTAPFSSAPFEHRHVDEHMVKGVRDNENGIDAPTALESTEVAERPKDNMVDEKKGAELTSGSVVVDDAKKVTVPDRSSPLAEEDGQPLNDACDDFKPEERVSLDEKREREQHNAPLENDEDVGESKSKKQRKQKGHHPESEKQDEFQQRAEHAQAVDEATKEVAGETSKKQKKKRNRKSETEHHMPSPDEIQFVEGDSIEVNDAGKVEGGDFTAVVSRRHKKKGHSPELVNAYEETHTTEPLRELDENVEEMHGEEGKLVDLNEQLSVTVAEGERTHESEEPSGKNLQQNSDSGDKQDQRMGMESAYDSQQKPEAASQERDDRYEQECAVEQKQPLEEISTEQPVQAVSQKRGKKAKKISLNEQALQQPLSERPDVEAVEHVEQQKVKQTEQHFEIVITQAERGEEQQQHEMNEPSEDRPKAYELLKDEDNEKLCSENAEQLSENVPEIESDERLQELKEELTVQSGLEKSQEPALSVEYMERGPPQQHLTPQSYDLIPNDDATRRKHMIKELTQRVQGSEYAHADMEQEFPEQLSTKRTDELRPEEGAEDQQYESEQLKAEERAAQQIGEELHLGAELLGQVSREESSQVMAQKEIEYTTHMLQEHILKDDATREVYEGEPNAEQHLDAGPKEEEKAQQRAQENLTTGKHIGEQPHEELQSISIEHVEYEPPEQPFTERHFQSNPQQEEHEEQQKRENLAAEQHITEMPCGELELVLGERVEHSSAEHPSESISLPEKQEEQHEPGDLATYQEVTERQIERQEPVTKKIFEYELHEQLSAEQRSGLVSQEKVQVKERVPGELIADQHYAKKPFEEPEHVPAEHVKYELLKQPSAEEPSESKPQEWKCKEQHDSEEVITNEEITEMQYKKTELIPTERMEHETFQQPSSEEFLEFREEERIEEEQQQSEKSMVDQYIADEPYRKHAHVTAGHVEHGILEQPTEPVIQDAQKKGQYGADELTMDQHVDKREYPEPEYLPKEHVRNELLEGGSMWKSELGEQKKHHEPTKSVADQHIGEKPHGEPEHVPTKYVENELLKRPHAEQPSECIPQEEEEQQHRPEELAANQNIAEKPYGELELEPVATESAKQTSAEEVAADVVQDEPKELQRTSQELIAHQRVAERSNGELESITAEQVEHEKLEPSSERSLESKLQMGGQTEQFGPSELSPDERPHGEPAVVPSDHEIHELLEPSPDSKPEEEIQEEQPSPEELTTDQHVVREAYPEPEPVLAEYVEHEPVEQLSVEQPSEPIIKDKPKREQQRPVELSADRQSVEEPCGKPDESNLQRKEEKEQYRPEELEADQNIPQKSYEELFTPAENAEHELPEQVFPQQPSELLVRKKLEEEQYRPVKSTADLGQRSPEQPSEPIMQDEPKEEKQVPMELSAGQQFAEWPHGKSEYVPAENLEQLVGRPEDVTEHISEKSHEVSPSDQPAEVKPHEEGQREEQEPEVLTVDEHVAPKPNQEQELSDAKQIEEGRRERSVPIGGSGFAPGGHLEGVHAQQLSDEQLSKPVPQERIEEKVGKAEELVEPSGGIMDAKQPISDGVAGVVFNGKDDTAAIEAQGGIHAAEELKKALPQAAVIEASKEIVEEVIPPPTALQTCTCEGPDNKQHTHKTTEVITTGDVPSGGQAVVDKTVTTLGAAGSPKQFAENVDKVAQEHPELMKNANIELGKHVTGKVTIATFTTRTAVTQEPMKVARRDPIMLALERGKRADLLRQRRERVYKLLPRDVEFCTRMIEAHGNDYEAMAKDPTNLYQETAKSIQRKIRIFYESPQYETYVRSKNSSPVLPPVNG
uniref:Nucleolar protein 16 n=1 Tax=Parascaris univalens TaxID=6257 RepID=A0A915A6F3_PARUN